MRIAKLNRDTSDGQASNASSKHSRMCLWLVGLVLWVSTMPHVVMAASLDQSIPLPTDLPHVIAFGDTVSFLRQVDSLIAVAQTNRASGDEAQWYQLKGQLYLQLGQLSKATIAYESALGRLNGPEHWDTEIKVRCGLGQIALEDGSSQAEDKASSYFSETLDLSRKAEWPEAMAWIAYYGGTSHIAPERYRKEEIEVMVDYADRELYSDPDKALDLANWLIDHAREYPIHIYDGLAIAGLVYRDLGEFHRALELFGKARTMLTAELPESRALLMTMLNISAIYAMQNQFDESMAMTVEVIDMARERGQDRVLAYALKDLGIMHMEQGEFKKADAYLQQAIVTMRAIDDVQGAATIMANLSNVYFNMDRHDEGIAMLDQALPILQSTGFDLLYASGLITKGKGHLDIGQQELGRDLILQGIEISRGLNSLEFMIAGFKAMIRYYAIANEPLRVEQYLDSLEIYHNEYQQKERVEISENLKVRYEVEKKQAQLDLELERNNSLAIENSAQRVQRNALGLISLLFVVLLLLLVNRQRLNRKLSKEREQRGAVEKELLQEQMRLSQLENSQLEEVLAHKQRELTSLALEMSKKNDVFQELEQKIKAIKSEDAPSRPAVASILNLINGQRHLANDWSRFKIHFNEVHPAFFDKLRQKYNLLSQTEEKHCAYMRMGLSTKEIARLMSISPSSVQISRYRLKKKMKLGKEEDLYQHINNI